MQGVDSTGIPRFRGGLIDVKHTVARTPYHCPKLDDARAHVEKLAAILAGSSIRSLTVVHMEVPCCAGLARIAAEAVRLSGANVPIEEVIVTLQGNVTPSPR